MIRRIFILLFIMSTYAAHAQNPYEIFGYTSNVEYESKVSELLLVKNHNISSPVRTLAFDMEQGFVLFLGDGDSILSKSKLSPDQLLRFLSVDPAANEYPGISPYAFVNNNPINAIDPDGRRILFINGYYMDNAIGRNIIGADKPGQAYWGSGFASAAQGFFNDYSKISSTNFINGSSSLGGDMSGGDRYKAGYAYAEANLKVITADMVKGETFKMVTHSEGSAYGAGVAQYLIDQGYKVETIVHLSPDEGDEFKTPSQPMNYQFGYKGDWVTGNKPISGVDKSGIAMRNDLGFSTVHGTTKSADVFNYVQDLTTVQTQLNIGMINNQYSSWYSQVPGTTPNGTTFSEVNQIPLRNSNGNPLGQ